MTASLADSRANVISTAGSTAGSDQQHGQIGAGAASSSVRNVTWATGQAAARPTSRGRKSQWQGRRGHRPSRKASRRVVSDTAWSARVLLAVRGERMAFPVRRAPRDQADRDDERGDPDDDGPSRETGSTQGLT